MAEDADVENVEYVEAVRWHLEHPEGPTDDECHTCGAYVLNRRKHADWHHAWRVRMGDVARDAQRYKSPPVYG